MPCSNASSTSARAATHAVVDAVAAAGARRAARRAQRPRPQPVGADAGRPGPALEGRRPGRRPGHARAGRPRAATRGCTRAWGPSTWCPSCPWTPAAAPAGPGTTSLRPSRRATASPPGPVPSSPCPASATDRGAACPSSGGRPSWRSPPTPARRNRTRAPGRARSVPGAPWWPTTCGSPRPTSPWPGRWRPPSGVRPCEPSVWPWTAVTQVSCNLVDPFAYGPAQAYDAVRRLAEEAGSSVARAELVGLGPAPRSSRPCPRSRRRALDLDPDRTVEARLSGSGSA